MSAQRTGLRVRSDEVQLKGTAASLSSWQDGGDPSKISRSAIYPGSLAELFDSGDVSLGIGLGGSATRTTLATLPAGWHTLLPLAVYMEVGGTVATGETVTISVKAVLDDGSEYEIASYSVTGATGSRTEAAPIANLLSALRSAGATKDGRRITSIVADASSSATATSATALARVVGVRL